MLKSYFDKSGQEDQQLLTIGGVAASDDVWGQIESDWNAMLQQHDPPAAYMHMKEAIPLRGEFSPSKGWTDDKVFGLVTNLLDYLNLLPEKMKYCHFACTLKMADYQKLQQETYQMSAPTELVSALCTQRLTGWYFLEYKGLDLEAHYYFDQGEPFEQFIKEQWEKETARLTSPSDYNVWAHITHMGPALMKKTPGLQIADMFAWATNRHEVKIPQRYSDLVIAMRSLIPSIWAVIDERQLRKQFRPLIYKPYGNEQL